MTSKKQKVLKCVASLTGDEDRFDVNRNAKKTLVLINVLRIQPYSLISSPHIIQLTKEKITLKALVLSREANTLPQFKSSCKEQASCDKKLEPKTLFLDQFLL